MYYPSNHDHHGKYVPQAPPYPVPPPGVLNTTYTPPPAEYQHPSYSSSNMPVQVHGTTQVWSTRLCHCFDDPSNCLITFFCPCVTFGQIAEIANRGSSTCVWHGAVYAILCMTGFPCLYSCFYRSKLRGQYDLEEAPCEDCLVHLGCEMCALCQEHRELKNHGFDMEIGWQANMDRRSRGVSLVAPVMDGGMRR